MTSADPRETIPARVGERYTLLDELGRGGMATVHRAFDEALHRHVAIKLLHDHLARDPAFLDRFRREARASASLNHANVVAVHDWGETDDGPYLVMQLIDGVSLRDLLLARHRLPAEEALAVLGPAATGLGAAHAAGFVHRDVKPENILLGRDSTVRITDFGLARAAASATATFGTEVLVGSPHYLSPEAVRGEPVDARSDVYALGVVLFECLTGRPPFEGESPFATAVAHTSRSVPAPSAVRTGIAPELDALVLAATTVDRDRRPDDGAAFARALGRAVPDGPRAPDLGDVVGIGAATGPGAASGPDAATGPDAIDASRLDGRSGDTRPPEPPGRHHTELLPVEDTVTVVPDPTAGNPRLPVALWRHDPTTSSRSAPDASPSPPATADIDASTPSPFPTDQPWAVDATAPNHAPGGTTPDHAPGGTTPDHAPGAPTPAHDDHAPGAHDDGPPPPPDDAPGRGRGRRVLLTLLVVAALLAASAGGGYLLWDRVLAPVTPIPGLLGASDTAARDALTDAGFEVEVATDRPHDLDVPADHVLSQEPVGTARRGTVVRLTLSAGPRQIPVPDVAGEPVDDAIGRIEATGLAADVDEQYDEQVAAGLVLRTDPGADAVLDETSLVTLVVSRGPQPIEVPDLIGVPFGEALTDLAMRNLEGEVVERRYDEQVATGRVIAQDPDSGTLLTRGGRVGLIVSDGPRPIEVPNVRGQSTEDAVATLESLGFSVEVDSRGGFGALLNPGRVFDQEPAGGAVRQRGDTVVLFAYDG